VHFHVADRREIEQTSRRVTDTSALRRRRETDFFAYGGRFYKCKALQFGWGSSPMWCTHLMMPLITKLRQSHRVLACLDDFLICLDKAGRIAVMRDCRLETRTIDKLLYSLGMARHPTKGEWNGSTLVEHLGCVIDTESMRTGSLCRLSHQVPMDLRTWKRLATVRAEGCCEKHASVSLT
jgi:hypothetical protein